MRFKFLQNKDNYIWLILVLALVLRLGAFFSFQPWEEQVVKDVLMRTDGVSYQNLALRIMEGIDNGETFWAPGFPLFLAGMYLVFGVKPWIILFFNCFLATGSAFILYRVAGTIFNRRTALLASLLFAVEPHQIIYTQTLFTENIFITLLLLFFYRYTNYLKDNKSRDIIFAAILLGLTMYVRPAVNYLFIPAILLIFIFSKQILLKRAGVSLLFLISILITLSPWLIRNYKFHDHFGLTTNGGYNLLHIFVGSIYNNQYRIHPDSTFKILQEKVERKLGAKVENPFILEDAEKSVAKELIFEEPYKFFQNYISGCLNIYTSLSSYQASAILGYDEKNVLGNRDYGVSQLTQVDQFLNKRGASATIVSGLILLFILFSYISTVAGIRRLYRDGRSKELVLLLGMILYFTLITGTLGSSARFKLPISPFYLIISAYGLNHFLGKRIKIFKG